MQHWLPFLNNRNQILFYARALGSNLEKRLTTSHLPILKPVSKPTLPRCTIYSKLLPLPSLTFYGPSPRALQGPAIDTFLVLLPLVENHLNVAYGQCKMTLVCFINDSTMPCSPGFSLNNWKSYTFVQSSTITTDQ